MPDRVVFIPDNNLGLPVGFMPVVLLIKWANTDDQAKFVAELLEWD